MNIKKAHKSDFNEYLKLKRLEEKDYSKIIRKKVNYPKDSIIKKEFDKALKSRKNLILFAKEDKDIIGYIQASYFRNPYSKGGYVEDIFIVKDFRRKGVAKKLINEFIKILKEKGYKKIQLSVNTKNIGAIKLYEKLGFKIHHYDLKKEWIN